MTIWAIADLHLAIGVPSKTMEVFGPIWDRYMDRLAKEWSAKVQSDDLILLAGDISWAMKSEEVKVDLDWIDALPGTKLMIRGNHDYWWSSASKVHKLLPPSCHVIQNNAFNWHGVSIAGTRLWDSPEYTFESLFAPSAKPPSQMEQKKEDEKIFARELLRLEMSLKALDKGAKTKIAMTHYPPIGLDLKPSLASKLFAAYGITLSVFGHLHNVKPTTPLFGENEGITYHLVAADYLNFSPLHLLET